MKQPGFYIGFAVLATALFFGAIVFQFLDLDPGRRVRAAVSRGAKPPAAKGPAGSASVRALHRAPTLEQMLEKGNLEDENRKLRAANKVLQDRLVAVLNWILANFKGKYPLPENYMVRLHVPAVTDDYILHPELAELLKVTAEEEQQLDDALLYARDYLAAIEAAIIQVASPRPDKVVLHIPTFREDGKLLQEDLYGAFEITLGPDRFDRFLQVGETELKKSFSEFGEAARTMVFELAYVDGEEVPRLKIKDGWVMELEPDVRTITATESVVTNLPPKYNGYIAWLPEYFAGYATE